MTARRNIIRPPVHQPTPAQINRRRQQIQAKVERAESIINRWWKRLQRAARAIDKSQKQIGRLQRQLRQLDSS
jgi:septal ring factor EnvC (AmiA/AmiB activator)